MPMRMFLGPDLLQPGDGRRRQAAGVAADKCGEGLIEITRRNALQVQKWDQHVEALRAARIGW